MTDDGSRVPKMTAPPSADVLRTLPLTPTDGFVLSRVDGFSSEADIANMTGLNPDGVQESIDKLALLGLISIVAPQAAAPRTGGTSSRQNEAAAKSAGREASSGAEGAGGEMDIDPEHRQRIDAIYAKLGRLDHYALLGVPRTADKKIIKRAYYDMATVFHPDRFFRKQLGPYKGKMEAIFAAATQAQDVLASKDQRAEYDAYLGDRAQTRDLEASVTPDVVPPPAAPASVPPAERPSTPPGRSAPPLDAQTRREALARRLRGARVGTPAPAPTPLKDPDALRRHYESRLGDTRTKPARHHAALAAEALAKGDAAAAVVAYKAALTFTPADPVLQAALAEAKKSAETVLAESYRRQAAYEEKSGNWQAAGKSWARLAGILKDDAEAHGKAAEALVKAGRDLHEAGSLAQRAVLLDAKNADYRVTLANVYLGAGLLKNAKRELEAAQQLSPEDDTIAMLLKRLAKG